MAGALLNLKPVIRVDTDGKYSTVAKGRSIGKSMSIIADHLREKYGNTPFGSLFCTGVLLKKRMNSRKEFQSKLNVAKMEVQRISPVLGVHTGPGIVGAAVVPMELMEDLA
jgi:fatty acid-binding protein DegV